MKEILNSFAAAFSMYSRIPMIKSDWGHIKYAMCFFPLVGAVIGAVLYLWSWVCAYFELGNIIFGAGAAVLPVIITGGIHIDGYLDTCDALSSYGDTEKKLAILKDPHCGAFAVIHAVVYFIVYFALLTAVENIAALSLGFVLSRALSALSVASFKCAKNSGLLYTFSDAAQKSVVKITMILYIAAVLAAELFIDFKTGVIIIALCAAVFVRYGYVSYRQFGGITGDLAGWFLCRCEMAVLFGAFMGQII